MHFTRVIDSSYPQEYEKWETDTASWVIQDLVPEDDETAIKVLVENLCTDETLCAIQKITEEPESVFHMTECWRECLKQRMSLGCYEVKNGVKTLVALNVCNVVAADDDHELDIKGEKWKNVYAVLRHAETIVDPYKLLGLDFLLQALGLVVKREYRGAKLGRRVLAAREPLCKSQGIKGTATVFTGIASQKLAESCGFQTISQVAISELAAIGLPYPTDDHRVVKYMVKKFAD